MNQLTIVLGILITNITNYLLRDEGIDAWRYMFLAGMIPSGLFLIGASLLPESPRWLMIKGKTEKAHGILNKLGKPEYANEMMKTIQSSIKETVRFSYGDAFKKAMLPALLAGIGLAVFQQFCGINTVFNYAPKIFESIGASKSDQLQQNVFIGAVNVIFTILAMALVDKVGRKPLMLIGAGGLCILYVVIVNMLFSGSGNVAWYLLGAIGTYAVSLAPVTWVLIAEIFPAKIRSAGITIATVCLWAAYFVLVFTFPILFEKLKENTFYIYAIVCAIGFVFVLFRVKETKGLTLEEVEKSMISH
jgi:sugar porter (SP) family MFS transporter